MFRGGEGFIILFMDVGTLPMDEIEIMVRRFQPPSSDILEERMEELNEDLESNDWMFGSIGLAGLRSDIERHKPWHEDELEVIPNGTETHLLF